MRNVAFLVFTLLACLTFSPAPADDDSVAAIFVFGRTGGWIASGFAVGDGSYIVTSTDSVMETMPTGKRVPVRHAAVVSRLTGDAYPATVEAVDNKKLVALLKLSTPAIPPVTVADKDALSRVLRATLGELLSGEEVGRKFPMEIFGLDVERKPPKFTVANWRSTNACLTEVRGMDWLFLSKVDPPEKATKASVVVKRGVGALGMFIHRLVIEGGSKPATFYQVLPCTALREFLTKSGVSKELLDKPSSAGSRSDGAENAFQAMCLALSGSITGAPAALDAANAAIKLRPKNATAHMLLGMALARQGKLDEAIKEISTAIELDPSLPDAGLNRAAAYAAAGKPDEAEKDLRKAIQDDPKNAIPMLALIDLLLPKEDKLAEAAKLAQDAIRVAPDDPMGPFTLARVLKRQKDYDGAIAQLKKLVDAAPSWGEAHVALAVTYEAAGKLDLAEREYRKLVEITPDDPDAHLTLIEFLIASDKKDDAKKEIEKTRGLKLSTEAQDALKKLEDQVKEQATGTSEAEI